MNHCCLSNLRPVISVVILLLITDRAKSDEQPTMLFLFAGQSNMVGYGLTADIPRSVVMPENVSIWKDSGWVQVGRNSQTFGPEIGFAVEVGRTHPKERIGIVKFSKGGTGIDEWNPDSSTSLYAQLMTKYRVASSKAADAKIAGMIWVQGERDCQSQNLAVSYASKLDHLVEVVRSDTGQGSLAFLCAQVNPPLEFSGPVRTAQELLPKRLPDTAVVSTDSLPKLPDKLHYDSVGQLELGKRFGKAFKFVESQASKNLESRQQKEDSESFDVSRLIIPGATFEGRWTNHAKGVSTPDAVSRFTMTVVRANGNELNTEWILHTWNNRWRFDGAATADRDGKVVFECTDVDLIDGTHVNEGNTTVVAQFSRNGKTFVGTAYYKSGRRSEFSGKILSKSRADKLKSTSEFPAK